MQTTLASRALALGLPRQSKVGSQARVQPLLARRRAPVRLAASLRPEDENKPDPGFPDPGFSTNPSPLNPAFTRRREHTVGRVAALGFGFSLVGELLTGIGPITQLHYETGLSYNFIYTIVLGLSVFGLFGALRPGSPTFDRRNQLDASKRGPPPNLFKEPRRFLMQNEVYIGRLAMAGFAGAVVLEYLWGGEAPLAHLGLITPGTSLSAAPWWTIALVTLFLSTGLGVLGAAGDAGRDSENF